MILRHRGYIALMSVLIVSVVLLIIMSTVSLGGFFSRFTIVDSESKHVSEALAESCFNTTLFRLAQNQNYTGNEIVILSPQGSCRILALTKDVLLGQTAIETQAVVQHAYTNLRIIVHSSSSSIVSWQEIPTL